MAYALIVILAPLSVTLLVIVLRSIAEKQRLKRGFGARRRGRAKGGE